jgi:hypothetical protein
MSQTQRFVIAIASIIVATGAAFGQDSALVKADAEFVKAVTARNRAVLKNLLDTDFTWTTAGGTVQKRSDILRQLPKTAIADEKNAESRVFTYGSLADIQVNQGRSHLLRVWVKRAAGWKAIVYQEVMSL